mmetsp:Transcript_24647/g.51279  ORF Transcript_24647/g.51279 Transcript_24647/m.51279 type:complete len:131 (+) Transcript_24647:53-445(+)|eukprot:CAMPEP_0172468736 /NCGR_PEP_ID=MMETSP1065-20121228/61990_1 /TAXON_ID=265537 /ORGANISM="Amphiprora paludosa, Strain CCMP125" /LENGTH=130 /DNA_ID=CAMNT_0013226191 /DNA_START=27 /DNA_END=419 /DNA_ORIENTATION=+
MRSLLLIVTAVLVTLGSHHCVEAFAPVSRAGVVCQSSTTITIPTRLPMSPPNDNDDDKPGPSPEQLGFTPSPRSSESPTPVRVDLMENVDPVNLTAIGFGLIALNFFVLANLGDGGIAGVVATIINTMNQ